MNNIELDIQEKNIFLLKERQIQLSELKLYFSQSNNKKYKEVISLNLTLFDEIYSKAEIRLKSETLLSLITSIGKYLELECPLKIILLCIKILEEHKRSINKLGNKGFLYKMFEYNSLIPINKDNIIKRLSFTNEKNQFYLMLLSKVCNHNKDNDKQGKLSTFNDFHLYLNYQMDNKQKPINSKENYNEIVDSISKQIDSKNKYYKLYTKVYLNYEVSLSDVISHSCDVIMLLYNRLIDKSTCLIDFVEQVNLIDDLIYDLFIRPSSVELQKLAEYILNKEFDELNREIETQFM